MNNLVVLTIVAVAIMLVVVGSIVVKAIVVVADAAIEVGKDSSNSCIVRTKAFGEGGGKGGVELYCVAMVVVVDSINVDGSS